MLMKSLTTSKFRRQSIYPFESGDGAVVHAPHIRPHVPLYFSFFLISNVIIVHLYL